MKEKLLFYSVFILSILFTVPLFLLKMYFFAIPLLLGWLILYQKEIWSLIRHGKLPPIDERIKDNVNRAMRNSFALFLVLSLISVVMYTIDSSPDKSSNIQYSEFYILPPLIYMLVFYILFYFYYDRIENQLPGIENVIFKAFALITGISVIMFIVNTVLISTISGYSASTAQDNVLSSAQIIFFIGSIGLAGISIKALFNKPQRFTWE